MKEPIQSKLRIFDPDEHSAQFLVTRTADGEERKRSWILWVDAATNIARPDKCRDPKHQAFPIGLHTVWQWFWS